MIQAPADTFRGALRLTWMYQISQATLHVRHSEERQHKRCPTSASPEPVKDTVARVARVQSWNSYSAASLLDEVLGRSLDRDPISRLDTPDPMEEVVVVRCGRRTQCKPKFTSARRGNPQYEAGVRRSAR